jgi:hypothetical protein
MGRPLSKQFFGNRNVGGSGEGIASISWSTLGAFQGNSNVQVLTAIPALPAPTIPGGVQATWTMQFEVESVFTGSGKTNLAVGDTFGVASVPGMVAEVTDISGANAIWSVTTGDGSRGDALALADIPKDTVGITLTKIDGPGTANTFLVDILFRVKQSTVTITEPGSGYDGTETFTFAKPGTTSGTVPAGTIVLTTGAENAIVIRANTSGAGTTAKVGDIVKQVSTRRYKVTTADGTGIVQLGTDDTPESGFGYIVATAEGAGPNTYYVTKLTRHKATLVTKAGDGALNGQAVQWGFSSPSGSIVQIENV